MLDELIASLDGQKKRNAITSEQTLVSYRILGDLAPRIWDELRDMVRAKCTEYSDRFIWEIHPKSELGVRSHSGFPHAAYLSDARRVIWQVGEQKGQYRIGLNERSDAVFVDESGFPYPLCPKRRGALAGSALDEIANC